MDMAMGEANDCMRHLTQVFMEFDPKARKLS